MGDTYFPYIEMERLWQVIYTKREFLTEWGMALELLSSLDFDSLLEIHPQCLPSEPSSSHLDTVKILGCLLQYSGVLYCKFNCRFMIRLSALLWTDIDLK